MTAITGFSAAYQNSNDTSADETSFNDKFLNYIKENKPDGDVNALLQKAKQLSSDNSMTMSKFNSALLYADTILRANPDYQDYTSETLDKYSTQMLGINMLTNKMMDKFISSEEDQDFL